MDILKRIYYHLLLNESYFSSIGLYFGKTGCLLFLAHYAKLLNDSVLDEIVLEVIDEIFEKAVSVNTMDIPTGLCGIGWGVEYILQNKLMEGDSDEILVELDDIIINKNTRLISSESDFSDILKYIVIRLTSISGNGTEIPFPNDYLMGLVHDSRKIDTEDIKHHARTIQKIIENGRYKERPIILTNEMLGTVSMEGFPFVALGLKNGLCGLGIRIMSESVI